MGNFSQSQFDFKHQRHPSFIMFASRTATRAVARSARTPLRASRQVRFQTTNQQAAKAGGPSGLVGGLAGGGLVFLAGYGYYYFSGAKTIVNAASTSKAQLQKLTQGIQDSAPEPNEALKWLRSTTSQYAAFIPGAKPYVDSAFNDLDKVQAKHGDEVDKAWSILEKTMSQLGELAKDSAGEII